MGANKKAHPQMDDIRAAVKILYPEGGSAPIMELFPDLPRTYVVRIAWVMGVKMTPEAKARQAIVNSSQGGHAAAAKAKHRRQRNVSAMDVWREEADPLELIALGIRR